MKILLAAINAKYIHSNLGIYSLKAYAEEQLRYQGKKDQAEISLGEYTINHSTEAILRDLYRRKPDVIGFSCYIWNIQWIRSLLPDLRAVLPEVRIWLGGPEVSFHSAGILRDNPEAELVMTGEGEETFAQLLSFLVDNREEMASHCGYLPEKAGQLPGIVFKTLSGTVIETPRRPVMDMDRLPFSYGSMDMKALEHRIIYYESSRGCPFSCSYCLSSIDKQVRFRSLDRVKEELSFFLKAGVPQVKFVDRTFNSRKDHAMAIWQFIRDHDNGVTNFHFEIAADLLDQEELELLASMRPGLVQLEIGVQSANPDTLAAIRRRTDLQKIGAAAAVINRGRNVHQHLDLIAGLPYEDLASFRRSFDQVYAMEPEQLQLGFLKVLKGSYMEEMAPAYGIRASLTPPYEVLSTRWLSYGDILELKAVEEMVEVYYNSRQFTLTLEALGREYDSAYSMFLELAQYYEARELTGFSHSRLARFEILWDFISACPQLPLEAFRDRLITDLYLRENAKSRPSFARDQSLWKSHIRELFQREQETPHYLTGYEGYDSRQLAKMAHAEVMGDGSLVLFDYSQRDPLTHNARAVIAARLPRKEELL
ncbi:MAG: B12-binding domain-containing radical SAM protein [Clostridiales bacterium]|nr:B12-binding domain-containing radical SAM protein [Clostridiales bacterium]